MARISLQSPLLLRTAFRRPTTTTARQMVPSCAPTTTRTFTNLPTLRPTLLNTTNQNSVFRAPNLTALSRTGPQPVVAAGTAAGAEGETIDVIARQSITGHPALGGVHQIRCGPRPTMSGHSRLIQKRRHGFLSRIRKHHGRNTLARRRAKGRKRLSA